MHIKTNPKEGENEERTSKFAIIYEARGPKLIY
jgi:hypothetical protein